MQKKTGHSLCRFLTLPCMVVGALLANGQAQDVKTIGPAPLTVSSALAQASSSASSFVRLKKPSRVLPSHLQQRAATLRSGLRQGLAQGRSAAVGRPMDSNASGPNFGGFAGNLMPVPISQLISDTGNELIYGAVVSVTGDFNGDGSPDVALLQTDGSISVILGDGKGGFSAPVVTPGPASGQLEYGYRFLNAISVDLDGDGKQDLVSWGTNGQVVILMNTGNGMFAAPVYLYLTTAQVTDLSQQVTALAVADINGDGHPDLVGALVDSAGEIEVNSILNAGDGTFPTSKIDITSYTPPAGTSASIFFDTGTIATVNGKQTMLFEAEEYPTLSGGPPFNGYVFMAASNGDGTFTINPSPLNIPSVTGTDADLQLVVPPYMSRVLKVQDLNNDGTADILIAPGDGYLYSSLGTGGGNFAPPVLATPIPGFHTPDFHLQDMDSDGWVDLLDSENGYTAAFHGNGDGTFTMVGTTTTGTPWGDGYGYSAPIPPGRLTTYGDFNADGKLDYVSVDINYGTVTLGAGMGGFAFAGAQRLMDNGATDQTPAFPADTAVEAAFDVNGDGKTDVAGFNQAGSVLQAVVGINQGGGVFQWTIAPTLIQVPLLEIAISPVTGDFNHDGKPDLIVYGIGADYFWHVYTALSNGDGTFQAPVEVLLPKQKQDYLAVSISQFAVGDVNGDGNPDIVMAYESPEENIPGVPGYYIALGDGTGKFPSVIFTNSESDLDQVALADFNGDGALDMVFSALADGANPTLGVLLNDGKGNFASSSPTILSYTEAPIELITADLNQDGKADLVMSTQGLYAASTGADTTQSGIAIYLGNGDGTFGDRALISEQGIAPAITVADFNGDGFPDILSGVVEELNPGELPTTTNQFYGASLLLNTGKGSFSPPINTYAAAGVEFLFAGNFYGVGGTDLLFTDALGTSIFYNQGTSTLALSVSGNPVSQGDTVALTATVEASMPSRSVPTGAVTFYDSGKEIGNVTLDGTGVATFSTNALAVGSNAITASYVGDSNFNPATQASAVTVTVNTLPPAFTLTASNSDVTVGQTGSTPLTLALISNATFTGSVALSATGLPAGVTVQFNPATVQLSGATQAQATMTIATGASTGAAASLKKDGWLAWIGAGTGISMAGLLLICVPRRRQVLLGTFVLTLTSLIGLISLTGCGGSSGSQGPKAGTTAQITVTATPSGSGASAQSTTVNITFE